MTLTRSAFAASFPIRVLALMHILIQIGLLSIIRCGVEASFGPLKGIYDGTMEDRLGQLLVRTAKDRKFKQMALVKGYTTLDIFNGE